MKSVRNRSYSGPYFPRIRTAYGKIQSISQYSVRTRENTDQENSEYGHFSHNGYNPLFQNVIVIISGFRHNDLEN